MPVFPGIRQPAIDNVADSEVSVINSVLARSMRRRLRDDFSGVALNANWSIVQQGTGQTITVANSELSIAAGTIANSETIIRSVATFKIPCRLFVILKLNQRIANQEFYLELIDATGQNYAQFLFDGTNASILKHNAANAGSGLPFVNLSLSGISGGSQVYTIYEIDLKSEEINFHAKGSDANNLRSTGHVRTRQIPDPSLEYYLQFRAKNLSVAPASTTVFTLDSIVLQEIEEFSAEVSSGRGGGNANQSLPVAVTNNISVQPASNFSISDAQNFATEIALPIAANATQTSIGKDASFRNTVRGWVFTNAPGTLIFEQSIDNTVWRSIESIEILGDAVFAKKFEFKIYSRYLRFRYINGATAQTIMQLVSTLFGIGA